jgi:hypothetical protein
MAALWSTGYAGITAIKIKDNHGTKPNILKDMRYDNGWAEAVFQARSGWTHDYLLCRELSAAIFIFYLFSKIRRKRSRIGSAAAR